MSTRRHGVLRAASLLATAFCLPVGVGALAHAAVKSTSSTASSSVFSDDFESGNLSSWTASSGLTVQQQEVYQGAWAGRATSTSGTASWAYKSLSPALAELYYDGRFKAVSQGNNNISLVRFRTSTAGAIASIFRRSDGALVYYNEVTGVSTAGPSTSVGVWHELEVHIVVNGTASKIEVWLDGVQISPLSKTDSLGTTPVGRVYIGDPSTGRTFDVAFDNEVISTSSDVSPPSTPAGLTATAAGSVRVALSWSPSADNVGVTGYTVYRNGVQLATVAGNTTTYSDTALSLAATYTYSADAFDAAGNHSPLSNAVAVTISSDTQAPTAPSNLTGVALDSGRIDLQWGPSTDNLGVTGYTVYRNGHQIATTDGTTTSYSDTTVSPSTTYSYTVDAFDAAANHSQMSNTISVATPAAADTLPPITPAGLTATGSASEIDLAWFASIDNVAVAGYTVYRNGIQLATVASPATSYADTTAVAGVVYNYTVDAFDAAGNHSAPSLPVSASLLDTIPPDAPTGLQATVVSSGEVDLSWAAPTDDVGVVGYTVYRNGSAIATVQAPSTFFADTTVAPATSYTYVVDAFDGAGNHSSVSLTVSAQTPAASDTTPPTLPTALAGTAVSATRVDLSWSASTDNVAVTGYTVYRNGISVGTLNVDGTSTGTVTFSDTLGGNPSPTTYSYTVDAFDAVGNRSSRSAAVSITVPGLPDTTPPTAPTNLTARAVSSTEVDLAWGASTDDVGVTGYTIYRNGSVLANVGGSSLSYVDTFVTHSSTYTYTVDAFDAAGNHSSTSGAAVAATPGVLFSDGFESGNLANWTSSTGVVVQQQVVYSGSWAARATSTGGASYAYKSFSPTLGELYADAHFKAASQGTTNVSIMRLRTSSAGAILSIMRRSDGKLLYYNEVTGVTTVGPSIALGTWHELEAHVVIAGSSSQVDIWLDGTRTVGKTDSLGTSAVGRVYIGEPATGRTFDMTLDDVVVSTAADVSPPTVPGSVAATTVGPNHVNVTWSPSTDNQSVVSYTIYRNNVAIASVAGSSTGYADMGASPSTTSSYQVAASDAAGNRSAPSAVSSATTPGPSSADPVIAAAGDIACDPGDSSFDGGVGTPTACRQRATSDILFNSNFAAVLPLGDNQYEDAALPKFWASYDPSWGRLQAIVRPVPGNHEYLTPRASGYFNYFGATAGDPSRGYYSYNVGSWHIIALNSECANVGGCGIGSPEEAWLRNDLAQNPAACTLAYWHEPRFSSGFHGDDGNFSTFWLDLYGAGADIVLNGHDHDYERFAPQDPSQLANPNGIREFVVGTGGAEHEPSGVSQPNSEVFNNTDFGVLELTLHPNGYDWSFVPAAGSSFTDAGSGNCH